MVRTADLNGIHIESFELTESQFNRVVEILKLEVLELYKGEGMDSLNDASAYVDEWISNDEINPEYRNWLKDMIDKGARIYTYHEDWQPISEVAIID